MVASMACVITGDEDDPSMIAGLLGVCTLCGTVVLAIPTFIYLIMIWLDDDDLEVPCGGNEDFESIDSVVVFACAVSPGCLAPLSDQLQLLVLSLSCLLSLLTQTLRCAGSLCSSSRAAPTVAERKAAPALRRTQGSA